MKRRHKVVVPNSRISSSKPLNTDDSPLLKVFHTKSARDGEIPSSSTNLDNSENESLQAGSRVNESQQRKVIKATITIPMPKADMGVIKFRSSHRNNG